MAQTLTDKLTAAIALQQQEVDRLTAVATVDLPAAKQKLNQLTNMLANMNPQLETTIAKLRAAGIRLDE
jgi:hypothetical protein